MRFPYSLLVPACALALSATVSVAEAATVSVYGDDLTLQFNPDLYQLPLSPFLMGNGFEMEAFSQLSGETGVDTSDTSFRLNLSNPSLHLVSLTLVQDGTYSLAGNGSKLTAAGTLWVSGVDAPRAQTSSAFKLATPFIADGALHNWDMTATANLSGSAWSDVRSLDLTVKTRLTAYAPDLPVDYAFISAKTASIQTYGISTGQGNPSGGSGPPNVVPLPASLPVFLAGIGTLLLFTRRRAGQ